MSAATNEKRERAGSVLEPAAPRAQTPASEGHLTAQDLAALNSKSGLLKMLQAKRVNTTSVLKTLAYEADLKKLQMELVKLQRTVQLSGRRVAVVFEGRDAAGKGGAIRRFIEHLRESYNRPGYWEE